MYAARTATLLTLTLVVLRCFARDVGDAYEPDVMSDEERARIVIDALTDPDAYVRDTHGQLPSPDAAAYHLETISTT